MDKIYTPAGYGPAVYLALNHAAGGLEIHDYIYHEGNDVWYVDLSGYSSEINGVYNNPAYVLKGSFVRSCYKAVERGITQWFDV